MAATVEAARAAGVTRLVALSAINADDDFSRQPSRFRGDRNKEVDSSPRSRGSSGSACAPRCSRRTSLECGRRRSGRATWSTARSPRHRPHRSPMPTSRPLPRRPCSPTTFWGRRIPLTGPAVAHQYPNGRDHRHRARPRPCDTRRFRRTWCGSASSALGFGAEFADAYIALLAETVDRPALVTHDVEKILDRPAALVRSVGVRPPPPDSPISKGDKPCPISNPPRFLKSMNKLVLALGRIGLPAGPSRFSRCPAASPANCAAPR